MDPPRGNQTRAALQQFETLEHLVVRRVKLARPLLSPDTIPRQRLLDQLDRALRCSLTLVVGPAGFGKTTTLGAWADQLAAPVAWLSLDEGDNDLVRFTAHLLAAVLGIAPELGQLSASLLCLPTPPSPEAVGMQLADELLDLREDVVLILDDFHLISDPGVHALVEALIRFPPPALHLVLGSRVDPPLPINRLRGRGLLVELRSRDLRFTNQEARAFFAEVSRGAMSPPLVDRIEERMEGWPAGLRLAWLALRDRIDEQDADRVVATILQDPVREYLIEEVVSHQPADVAEFLLRTSILDRLCGPLCEALLAERPASGWSQDILDTFARGNPFLAPLDLDRVWFRYHHLFQQVLRHRLQLRYGDVIVNDLHARASAWFAGQGMIDEAVRHALSAGDGDTAARLVEAQVHPALHDQSWFALGSWLRQLPDQLVRQRPGLLLARAWFAELGGHFPDIEAALADIESLLGRQHTSPDETAWLTTSAQSLRIAIDASRTFLLDRPLGSDENEIEALTTLTLDLQGEAEAIARAIPEPGRANHVAGSWMQSTPLIYRSFALHAIGQVAAALAELREATRQHEQRTGSLDSGLLMAEGIIQLLEGQLAQVDIVARRLLRTATRENLRESIAWAHLFLGMTSYERNDLDAAAAHLEHVADLSDYAHNVARFEGQLAMSLLLQAQGLTPEAQAAVRQLLSQLEENGPRAHLVSANSFQARLGLMQGNSAMARDWLSDPISAPAQRRMVFAESLLLTRAWALLASKSAAERDRAIRLLKQLRHDSESAHRWWLNARVLALLALAYDAQGRPEVALSALQEAVALAAPRGLIRTFVDYGPHMERLLRRFTRFGGSPQHVSQILAAFPAPEQRDEGLPHLTSADDELIERLSDRELEILRLMHQHLTNQEIGERLFISPLTVKRHSINIYGKLGVSSRRAAILKGSALGLVPSI